MGQVDSAGRMHAILAPSSADRWMTCSGSVKLSKDLPNLDNEYTIEGVDHHEVAAVCLEEKVDAATLVGRPMLSGALLEEEGAGYVQKYVDMIRGMVATTRGTLLIEQAVPLEWLTGEKDAKGTADAVIIPGPEPFEVATELIIADLKYGRGVEVEPENNRQAMIYALGVLQEHQLWDDYKTVRIVICQPRTTGTKEWVVTTERLKAFDIEVRNAALNVRDHSDALVPSQKACKFCPAKGVCPALKEFVEKTMTDGFGTIDLSVGGDNRLRGLEVIDPPGVSGAVTIRPTAQSLGTAMSKIALIEEWIKGVRAEVERRLLAGEAITGWKLVQGKRGNRKWTDEKEVEEIMRKSFRLPVEDVYDMTVISPTTAEKRFKEHPKQWARLEDLVTQSPGVPSVAPESDKRAALVIGKPEDGFEKVTNEWEDLL